MFGKISMSYQSQGPHKNNSMFKNKNLEHSTNSNKIKSEKSDEKTILKYKSKKIKKDKMKQELSKSIQNLQGAKFRILNQMLYTRQSNDAIQYFNNNKEDFQIYHQGFRYQTTKWKYRPIDQILLFLINHKAYYLQKTIVDLGCGEGFLYQQLVQKGFNKNIIFSYDLVSTRPFITVADIANLPLTENNVDLCIFCLSLMGTNYLSFIEEAWRILKAEGQLIISEVQSRSSNWKKFIRMIEFCGFQLENDGLILVNGFSKAKDARYFRSMIFKKKQNKKQNKRILHDGVLYNLADFSKIILEGCLYKKR